MISDIETPRVKTFATVWLPWLLGAGMLMAFLATLNYWLTPYSLMRFVELAGWNNGPHILAPVTYLATYPLRFLPVKSIPLAMNLFTAVCAALTLCLLARSVTLLPHDRTYDQRQREHSEFSILTSNTAWAPPLFAVLVCGLQLTFWENAVETTGAMFDLLLFAYVIRCLLEYRVSEKESWLTKFALVYGLGMANDWGMVGFFPAFLAALVWIKGLAFFNAPFLLRTFGIGLAGFSLFFLFPLLNVFHPTSPEHFWEMVQTNLTAERGIFLRFPRMIFLVLSLTSLLPVFIISIRWASYFGDNSPLGIFLATATFHVIHAVFFVICLWVALDSPISPRIMGYGLPFLTFYYLGALCIGYFSGYFLLIFGSITSKSRQPGIQTLLKTLNITVTVITWLILIAVPLILVRKNLPRIQTYKIIARGFENYFARIEQSLPPTGAVLVSDDPIRSYYLKAMLNRQGKDSNYLIIDTGPLGNEAGYVSRLAAKNSSYQFPVEITKKTDSIPTSFGAVEILEQLSKHHSIYYLHPSFGFFFEHFYPEANGLIYRLKTYPPDEWDVPLPVSVQISENQKFWKQTLDDVSPWLAPLVHPPASTSKRDLWETFQLKAHLKDEPYPAAGTLGAYYSRALDYWGVELLRANLSTEAWKCFDQALELNPGNGAAIVNKIFVENSRDGKKRYIQPLKDFEEKMGAWVDVLNADGPIDEPNCRDDLANSFARSGNVRQAIQQLNRIKQISPDDPAPSLQLAQLMLYVQAYTNSLTQYLPSNQGYNMSLSNSDEALKMLSADPAGSPNRTSALFLKSVALMQMKDYQRALEPLNQLLLVQTNYAAQLNRAIAFFKLDNLDAAKRDYEVVGDVVTNAYQVFFGLGEIAYKQKDIPTAIKNYELYLTNAPPGTEEAKSVYARLKELQTKSAP